MVKDDLFTSIHIEEFECVARDTKLGKEEITRDIPNVGEEALQGPRRVGHRPDRRRGQARTTSWSARSRRRARPSSRRRSGCCARSSARRPATCATPRCGCRPAWPGTVIGAQVFSRRGVEKDERARAIEEAEIERLRKDQEDEIRIIRESALEQGAGADRRQAGGEPRRRRAPQGDLARVRATRSRRRCSPRSRSGAGARSRSPTRRSRSRSIAIFASVDEQAGVIKAVFDEKIARLKKGDELPPGVFKMVKVYVAIKRKLSVGDKMAGRHGNKGVISRILPEEDMPYMADGTPGRHRAEPARRALAHEHRTDPRDPPRLGGPRARRAGRTSWSRSTQASEEIREQLKEIYHDERISARARRRLRRGAIDSLAQNVSRGIHVATAVFDGAKEDEIKAELERAGAADRRARRCSSTGAPASRSTRTSRSASSTC